MYKYFVGFVLLINVCVMAQETSFINDLYFDYSNYKEISLAKKRIKHADIIQLMDKLKENKKFEISKVGKSAQKRDIHLIKYGNGKTKVFLWSQMHGDESTATMGLFDIFNFLTAMDRYDDLRKLLNDSLTIYFIPMVNPDGAEVYQRRNAYDIDINRDYVNKQTPEARMLRSVFDTIRADFGFNLHDQNGSYAAGESPRNAAISFLAPAVNYNKDITPNRKVAMQVIAAINKSLKQYIPGHIAKYNDDFEPRAFGDNFQKEGMSTILIESGGWLNDTEKQFVRKLNFLALISAFINIANSTYTKYDVKEYESIPFNKEIFSDVILRSVTLKRGKKQIVADVAVKRVEKNSKDYKIGYYESEVDDIGDLTGAYGLEEYDCTGLTLEPGKIFSKTVSKVDTLEDVDINKIFLEGCTTIQVKKIDDSLAFCKYPINVCSKNKKQIESKVGSPADFGLYKDGELIYIMVNGYLYDPNNETGYIANGRINR
ncbi:MAG: M14 family zinc carboxypeptidase [Bacteroidota bacterium]|nr:M14 family zinc carboxypeptidase [Bacteroidota bacterium]